MDITYKNDEIIIRIPCDAAALAEAPLSNSGKTRLIASTRGFIDIPGAPNGMKLSINVSIPRNK